MDFSDTLYIVLLIFSICFGKYINKISDVDKKQRASTVAGFAIVSLVSGRQLVYLLLIATFNSLFILRLRRFSHILTFVFSFTSLSILRYHQCLSGHVNLILMMLTLKLIGLSFELHDNRKLLIKINSYDEDWDHGENSKYLLLPHSEMSLTSIFHYSFCYVGVLTGPYYTYQTYLDWCNPRLNLEANLKLLPVLSRLKFVPFYALVFLVLSHFYPVQYVLSEQFFSSHCLLYRWFYSLPVFFAFKMRLYIGLLLSEAVAIMVGLGSYPSFTQSRAGQGPTTSVIFFRKIALGESEWQRFHQWTADFSTIQSVNVKSVETEPTLRKTIKLWNSTVQFWMQQYVYRRISDTRLRLYVVFLISALWHGLHSGYYLSLCYMPLYLHLEYLYAEKLQNCLPGRLWPSCIDLLLLTMKTLTLSSLSICFTLLSFSPIYRYFSSLYYLPFVVHLLLYLGVKEVARRVEGRTPSLSLQHSPVTLENNNVYPTLPAEGITEKSLLYKLIKSS